MTLFHTFGSSALGPELPSRFNNPFYYSPHPLCVAAAGEVRGLLSLNATLQAELSKGKMLGVLVAKDKAGNVGYFMAFSGLLFGKNSYPGFVPPVYDMQNPTGYFKCEEAEISALNKRIQEMECEGEYPTAVSAVKELKRAMEEELSAMREDMRRKKLQRDAVRAAGNITPAEESRLVRESQFWKAELRRVTKRWQQNIAAAEEKAAPQLSALVAMKEERKRRSAALQHWLFEQFKVFNGKGEEKSLLEIFASHSGILPPAGAGECAAPKLLQYAYKNGYTPVAMAEFWVGESPAGEVRHDGCFYGSCKSKCEPILSFMLQGVDVEENALEKGCEIDSVEVVYEDEYLVVVSKPPGVLSVPGLVGGTSIQEWLRTEKKSNEIYVVHRLDMATSGLLVAAKSMEVYKAMQAMFAARTVFKRYIALLGGVPEKHCGRIEIPLAPDYDNRPRQKVDYAHGKEAVTEFKVLKTLPYNGKECALVEFRPLTGRTHQLRVHAACNGGLAVPIVGDALYGTVDKRLMLHAATLEFTHPVTNRPLRIEKEAVFEI